MWFVYFSCVCVYMCRVVEGPLFPLSCQPQHTCVSKFISFVTSIFRVEIILIVPIRCTFSFGQSVYPSSHLYLQIEVESLPKTSIRSLEEVNIVGIYKLNIHSFLKCFRGWVLSHYVPPWILKAYSEIMFGLPVESLAGMYQYERKLNCQPLTRPALTPYHSNAPTVITYG